MKLVWFALATGTFLLVVAIAERGSKEKLFLVDIKEPSPHADPASKLGAALTVTRISNGILKGADDQGRPVLALSPAGLDRLKAANLVRSIIDTPPADWTPVSRLKLSYYEGNKLTAQELEAMGLKVLEDYAKGAFLLVEPINHRIDGETIKRLESSNKVRYVAPVMSIKAAQSHEP